MTALFFLAAVLIAAALSSAGLIRRYHARLGQSSPTVESAAATQVEPPAPACGLSRQRKGFDAAIAVLRSAADQNHHLAGYYSGVVKRTGRQAAEVEAAASAQESVNNQKSEPPTNLPAVATAAGAAPIRPGVALPFAPGRSVAADASEDSARAGNTDPHATQDIDDAPDQHDAVQRAAPSLHTSSTGQVTSGGGRSGLVAGDIRFDLNPAIDHWVQYYTASRVGRSTMQQGLERCGAYLDDSRAEFRQLGLPEDLVWLAQVESVWKQGAKSPVAAGGIWQFMPATAADYGLAVGRPVDERFDPTKETRAAATYLRDLYTLFGNWELAMAAYNCGEPRLMDAIVRCGQPDFWALSNQQLLPKETCNYVPKILAAIKVASAAETYGFTVEPQSSAPPAVTPGF